MAKEKNPSRRPAPRQLVRERIGPRGSGGMTDAEAMIDMSSAFGHGARKYDPEKDWTWTDGAVLLGYAFMSYKLQKNPGKYWTVRDKAVKRAKKVGFDAAKLAKAGTEITYDHLDGALRDFGWFKGGSREDCPF